jgi:hypothetical protein
MSEALKFLSGKKVIWCTITIPAAAGSASDLWTLAKAGFGDSEDVQMGRIAGWRLFKEKDNALAAYYVGDDASLTVAESFAANQILTSGDYPASGKALQDIFVKAAAGAAITAGFAAFLAPSKV